MQWGSRLARQAYIIVAFRGDVYYAILQMPSILVITAFVLESESPLNNAIVHYSNLIDCDAHVSAEEFHKILGKKLRQKAP